MKLNSDFAQRAVVHAAALPWTPSPMPGVERRMLDRVGGEIARATSIVRYAPGSHFSPHAHDGGEEFLVLEGVFQDEHGDYPAGAYLRNPPGSSHTPGSTAGCTIFVKLWQFEADDRTSVRQRTRAQDLSRDPRRSGVRQMVLHQDKCESVRLEQWAPGTLVDVDLPGGAEILGLDGSFTESSEEFTALSWLRLPCGARLRAKAGTAGARVWIKDGHLAHVMAQLERLPGSRLLP